MTSSPDGSSRPTASVASADVITTAHICDVGPWGLVLDGRIRSIWPGARVSGVAVPVKVAPGDNASLHQVIEQAEPGSIVVVDGAGFEERALWGAIMSHAAMLRGIAGLVVDGAIRDVAEITEMRFPVFASSSTPVGPYNKVHGSIGREIQSGGVRVCQGDVVYADDDGVVVLPADDAPAILELAQVRASREEQVVAQLDLGKSLSEAVKQLRPEGR
jgi:4-hydroxy-4-methyl-2-oxoglutarate aldolase